MKRKRILGVALVKRKQLLGVALAVLLSAVLPTQTAFAEEDTTGNTTENAEENAGGNTEENTEEKTAEELEAEAKAKLEAEKKEALEIPIDTNGLANWPEGPAVYAHSAIVMDMDSGAVLYAKRPDERHFPASITKLLTTLVALENAELTDKVTFSQESVDILNWDDANIGMRPEEEISMHDALRAVLLASANEVSYAVAESTGINRLGGNYDTFIRLMNERSKELGCTGSNWVNPNGLHDEQHYTTAHDMALITSALYQEEEFHNIMDTLEYRIPPTNLESEERVFQQNHKMLWEENYYYYEYCTGGKTGYTDQSGTTLVTTADNGELRLAAVVLYDYGVDAYTDTRAMLDYVFEHFSKVPLSAKEQPEEAERMLDEEAYVVLPEGVKLSDLDVEICRETENSEPDESAERTENSKPDESAERTESSTGRLVYKYQGQNVGSVRAVLKKSAQSQIKEKKTAQNTNQNADKNTQNTQKQSGRMKAVIAVTVAAAVLLLSFRIRKAIRDSNTQKRHAAAKRSAKRKRKSNGQSNGQSNRKRTKRARDLTSRDRNSKI